MISCSCVREAKPQVPKEIKFVFAFVTPSSNGIVMLTDIISFLVRKTVQIIIQNQQQIIQVFHWLFSKMGDKPESRRIIV